MASDAKGPEQSPALQANGSTGGAASLPADAAVELNMIGYECADPALQAPLWAEAVGAGATPKSLR
jgi:hypothetical protein